MIRRPWSSSRRSPWAVEPVAARSSTSSAVGPSSTLPNTVGATSTPFVVAVGTGSSTWRSSGRASSSNTISSPRRGRMVKESWPNSRCTTSPASPAAFTTNAARTTPAGVVSSCPWSPAATAVTGARRHSAVPLATASVAKASGTDQGSITSSSGTASAPSAPGPRCGSSAVSSRRDTGWVAW